VFTNRKEIDMTEANDDPIDTSSPDQPEATVRRSWWIDNPPWCWNACLVSTFNEARGPSDRLDEDGKLVRGERVGVVEVKPDDPDFDALLAAIDRPRPREVNEETYAEAAAWILNVMRARCQPGYPEPTRRRRDE
jgi:hypothetical protein